MAGGLCLVVCRNYLRECESVLARIGGEGAQLAPCPATCGRPMLDWPTLGTALIEAGGAAGRDVRVIGGGCLLRLGEPPPGPWGQIEVHGGEYCFDMIAGSALVRHLLGRLEHLEHYRRVAETVARVCGLALANAVDYQRLQTTVEELTAARDSVRTLAGLIPICAHCKKIRDDAGYWKSVETYVQENTEATMTHGICPACIELYFPGYHAPAPKA